MDRMFSMISPPALDGMQVNCYGENSEGRFSDNWILIKKFKKLEVIKVEVQKELEIGKALNLLELIEDATSEQVLVWFEDPQTDGLFCADTGSIKIQLERKERGVASLSIIDSLKQLKILP